MMKTLTLVDRSLGLILRTIAIACLAILMLILGGNVISRMTGWFSMGWYDEIIELCFAWMIFSVLPNFGARTSIFGSTGFITRCQRRNAASTRYSYR